MSGTSLDGIDVALIRSDGHDIVEQGPARTYPYAEEQRQILKHAIAHAKTLTNRNGRPLSLGYAEEAITNWHARAVQDFLKVEKLAAKQVDVIGFHGQTVLHRPEASLTVQLGLGAELAKAVGIPVVHDLRAADMEAGGEGAPLVPVYHQALAARFDDWPLAFLNIGGIANITWIGKNGELIAFDTGPGNALLNDWMMRHAGMAQDTDGKFAARGKYDEEIVDLALDLPFFEMSPPKSLDRDAFQGLPLDGLSPENGAATLCAITVASILMADDWLPQAPKRIIVCGGGRHNPMIMDKLPDRGILHVTAEEAGLNGDSIEAEAWAYLAIRSRLGLPITFPRTTGVKEPTSGGVLSLP
jgi:anhydro-N-acetylmuramic acid kinase